MYRQAARIRCICPWKNTQFTMKGVPICEDQQEFVWVEEILAVSIEE